MRILNFGSMNIDYVFRVPHTIRSGESMAVPDPDIFPGGKGLNQSIAAARAGASVFHAGCIGKDGVFLKTLLQENGVNTQHITVDAAAPSGGAYIQVEPEGANTILICGGANQTLTPRQIHSTLSAFSPGDILMLQNETNAVREIIEAARKRGLRIFFNPSPITPELLSLPYGSIDLLIVNEEEGAALAGGRFSPEETLEQLHTLCPHTVILTLGAEGAMAVSTQGILGQRAYPANVVDTTGAGDTFTGYIAAALAKGKSLASAMDIASRAAAISVSRPGAAVSIPNMEESQRYNFPSV